jgi:hypothetical protein
VIATYLEVHDEIRAALAAGRRMRVAGSFFGLSVPTSREMCENPEFYVALSSGPYAIDVTDMGTTLKVDGIEYFWHAPEPGDPNYYG